MRILPLPGTLLLTALLVGLALAVSKHQGSYGVMSVQASQNSTSSEEAEPRVTRDFSYAPSSNIRKITDRPIFSPNRRPKTKQVEKAEIAQKDEVIIAIEPIEPIQVAVLPDPPPPPIPEFQLRGVMLTGQNASALVSVDGAQAEWINKKEMVIDWVLSDITENTIKLEQTGRSVTIPLYPD